MQYFEEIVKQAVVGLSRSPETVLPPSELASFFGEMEADSPEKKFLERAGVFSVYAKAGFQPETLTTQNLPQAPPETATVCGEAAAQTLDRMFRLFGRRTELLAEALDFMIAHNRTAPFRWTAILFQMAENQPDIARRLSATGERGKWLAAQKPNWQKLYENSVKTEEFSFEADWENGSRSARLRFFTQKRIQNPAEALLLLQTEWAKLPAAERTELLACLANNLSTQDIPFLENAAQDKTKEARKTALSLLCRLPESAAARRLYAALNQAVVVQDKGYLGKIGAKLKTANTAQTAFGFADSVEKNLTIKLPELFDEFFTDSAVNPKQTFGKLGEKASYLIQLLHLAPLTFWTETAQLSPRAFLLLVNNNENERLILNALTEHPLLPQTPEMLEALSAYLLAGFMPEDMEKSFKAMLNLLPTANLEKLIDQAFQADDSPLHDTHPAFELLRNHRSPWSSAITRRFLSGVADRIAASPEKNHLEYYQWHLRDALHKTASYLCLDPFISLKDFYLGDPSALGQWTEAIEKMNQVLQIRFEARQAILS